MFKDIKINRSISAHISKATLEQLIKDYFDSEGYWAKVNFKCRVDYIGDQRDGYNVGVFEGVDVELTDLKNGERSG